jgi:hypothetical protein
MAGRIRPYNDNGDKPKRKRSRKLNQGMPGSVKAALFGSVLLVVGVIAFLVVRHRMRDKPSEPTETVQNQTPPNTPAQPTAAPPAVKRAPDFKPDAEAVQRLGAETEISGRVVRVPKGWVEGMNKPVDQGQTITWKDPTVHRDDGTEPLFQVIVVNLSQEQVNDLAWRSTSILDQQRNRELADYENVVREPAESGYINGVHGTRGRWKGRHVKSKREVSGVVYVFFDSLQMVVMAGIAGEGTGASANLAEAAMLSIRRK